MDERDKEFRDPDKLVTVACFTLPIEAELAMGRLESAGIHCFLPEEQMSVISTFGLTVTGGIRLQVCVKDEKDARAILTDAGI